ncbi:uncharacterized protein LOC130277299 isoform X2 [Hyla sarda]|uniref:uncharacterized protein LOC130277299 isoform X2 n=1 Tax=Hyla sarda TaxID=327740 RepID=UPI0024C25E6D|nr:uncharacterized protein LOC130277299 isoform X2 [Hyla sarda]
MEITQCLPQKFHLKVLVIFYIFLSYYSTDGQLEIRSIESPIVALQGQNTTLPCLFYGYGASPLDLSKVAVRWNLRTSEGKEKQVYLFNGGHRNQYRNGSYIPDKGLMVGDGSLYIPNIQFSDDGEYTCTVFVTPEKAESKVTMEVSAKPTCTLSDSRLEMTPGTERSVTCYVNGFYPKPVEIFWVKYSKDFTNNSELDSQTCTSENRDETYNVTSLLSVRPMSTDENGDVYSCIIIHRSLKDAVNLNISLSVLPIPGDKNPISITWIIVIVVLAFAILALVLAFTLCYCLVKVKPDVSEISNEDLIHMKESILECHISGFRPCNLNLELFWKNGKEKIPITSWSSKKRRERSQENDNEETEILLTKSTDPVLETVIKLYKWWFFRCDCSIRITPQLKIHRGKILALDVHHPALKAPVRKMKVLNVISPATIEPIETKQESYNIGEELELTCKIHSFYPKSIQVFWYKDTEEILQLNNKAKKNDDGLYDVVSRVKITVTKEDFIKIFRCKAKHQCNTTEDVKWKMEKKQVVSKPTSWITNIHLQESFQTTDFIQA